MICAVPYLTVYSSSLSNSSTSSSSLFNSSPLLFTFSSVPALLQYRCIASTLPPILITTTDLSPPLPPLDPSPSAMHLATPRNPPPPPSSGSRSHRRLSNDMKSRAPLPVPSGAQSLENGHSRNLSAGLDVAARSPPNQSSMSDLLPAAIEMMWFWHQKFIAFLFRSNRSRSRYQTRPLQILPPGNLSSWPCLSVLALHRRRSGLCTM